MAKPIPHLLRRGDTYYARLVVPKPLRSSLENTTELRILLGQDKIAALQDFPAALASLRAKIEVARRLNGRPSKAPAPRKGSLLSTRQLARHHYASELALDTSLRNS